MQNNWAQMESDGNYLLKPYVPSKTKAMQILIGKIMERKGKNLQEIKRMIKYNDKVRIWLHTSDAWKGTKDQENKRGRKSYIGI